MFKRTLFIKTRQNQQIFRVIRFLKLQNINILNLQNLNSIQTKKN